MEGHTPWKPDTREPDPVLVADVTQDPSLRAYLPAFLSENIAALTFIPLVSDGRVIGKFMLYWNTPQVPSSTELDLARLIATQVAFAIERTRAEAQARTSAERLRFALEAASMGTWDWDLSSNLVQWSENLEAIHGLPAGTFDGTFGSYEREIHPEDRERVLESARRALSDGTPHDVEYRIVAPDGTVRWCEGKGMVEYEHGRPVRMIGVCVIVTRRKEAELARLAAAEIANRAKDEFLATLSHELRTPLNAILGWVQMVQSGELSPDRTRHAIEVIGRNARLQAQLMEEILDVSRIIAGKLQLDRVPLLVPHLVENAVAGVAPSAAAKHISISQQIATGLPLISGDPHRLHQVLNNVLSNAVKFSAEGGAIAVECGLSDNRVMITVRDNGVGIAPEVLPHVFDRFRQGDSRSSRRHGGLGLGLAIARHLCQEHGGDIEARSDGVGLGTTVVIRLRPDCDEAASTPAALPEAPPVTHRLDGLALLVVDDQEDSRDMLSTLLEQRGARVTQCGSAVSALSEMAAKTADVLIADIGMPDVDGYQLIRRVRELGYSIPAIAVTAFARPDDRVEAAAAGYAAYCPKPIDVNRLVRMVRDASLLTEPLTELNSSTH